MQSTTKASDWQGNAARACHLHRTIAEFVVHYHRQRNGLQKLKCFAVNSQSVERLAGLHNPR